jgi:hypothetical protein
VGPRPTRWLTVPVLAAVAVTAGCRTNSHQSASPQPGARSGAEQVVEPTRRLYFETYEGGFALRSITLGRRAVKRRIARVPTEGAEVAATRANVFWASCSAVQPDRLYRFDRSGGHRRLLVRKLDCPPGLAVAGGRVYWISDANIGRISVGGTGLERTFMHATRRDLGGVADGLATDGTYLYFTRCRRPVSTIGRVRLDGSGVDRRFISLAYKYFCPQPIAYAAGHLYWLWTDENTTAGRSFIGRASTDGTQVEPTWLEVGTGGGAHIAAGGGRVFWEWGGGAGSPVCIGEASLTGRIVARRFLCRAETIAVD